MPLARVGFLSHPLLKGSRSTPLEHLPEDKDHAPTCTLETLKGRYLFGGIATLLPPAVPEQSLLAVAGYHIFNGDGTGMDFVTFTVNGVDQNVTSPNHLTYTLNSDCTGTYTVLGPPGGPDGPSFAIFVSPNGDEMTSINIEPVGAAGSFTPSRRVAPK